jgi:hypothetical protein
VLASVPPSDVIEPKVSSVRSGKRQQVTDSSAAAVGAISRRALQVPAVRRMDVV